MSDSVGTNIFQFHKSEGQHILKNPMIAQQIVDAAEIRRTDVVLEIGPGTGNLTMKILPQCKKLIAIEIDPRMAAELKKRVSITPYVKKIEIITGDFLKVDLPYFDVCVSNTPYSISSPLVFKLLNHRPQFRSAVLMFQREFALRLVATPEDPLYCRLTVNTHLLADIYHVMKVGRNNFKPPPKVESSVVRMVPVKPAPQINLVEFDGFLRICFLRKHKTLKSLFTITSVVETMKRNLEAVCKMRKLEFDKDKDVKNEMLEILREMGMDQRRSVTMTLDEFLELILAFMRKNYHFC
ncbi:dimethyladenosine transferase, putative [Entamoeba invadens IP1]|uniref:rRNA adenine N(6)-methyltransferase n=1 Tax=Entamoeba invadens IP1 TaxID=370355 RepID=A0A0A1U0I2_ENTIV|nr:dimethyladenosine transferase, putative [Entamoeba invadens IP1]ELP87390.1 dimethyladenosine transferase, putative [Entamoeba invadens IP1]|eukprot:XP_004254161.1 dimethyladenosine transferase, putative [Entamoeba invadens IP1]